jgi:hypothetical protein
MSGFYHSGSDTVSAGIAFVDLQGGDDAEGGDADADHSRALESFRLLCGDADCDALRGFLGRASESEGGDGDASPIILSADADKAHRSVRSVRFSTSSFR